MASNLDPTWTDERCDHLRTLWDDGLSARQIASELGDEFTRNMVLGKVSRLGLPSRTRAHRSPRKEHRKARASRTHGVNTDRIEHLSSATPTQTDTTMNDDAIPQAQRKSLFELTDETCKWPVGDVGHPSFFFCGGVAITGLPYCAYHARIAYRPLPRSDYVRPFKDYRRAT
jgi:GcrA cell cycle regulator